MTLPQKSDRETIRQLLEGMSELLRWALELYMEKQQTQQQEEPVQGHPVLPTKPGT